MAFMPTRKCKLKVILATSLQLSRQLHITTSAKIRIKNVTVLGGGQMGSGIAQTAAQTGHDVTVVDVSDEVLRRSAEMIKHSLTRVAKKKFPADEQSRSRFISETLSHLTMKTDKKESVAKADVVVEAIAENLEVKQKVFAELDKYAPQHTLFVTNTSSLSVRDISSTTSRRDRFGGMHFFNPVPVMKLVEVVRIPEATEETFQALVNFGQALGKTTVQTKDTLGFIVNRLFVPHITEAIRMVERGEATVKDIDTAMRLGAGYPMGPFEVNDLCGLDINKAVIDGWHKKHPEEPLFATSPLLDKMVAEGKLGVKSGEGFYVYNKKKL